MSRSLKSYSIAVLVTLLLYVITAVSLFVTARLDSFNDSRFGSYLAVTLLIIWLPFWAICRHRARAIERMDWFWLITFIWPLCLWYIFKVDPLWRRVK